MNTPSGRLGLLDRLLTRFEGWWSLLRRLRARRVPTRPGTATDNSLSVTPQPETGQPPANPTTLPPADWLARTQTSGPPAHWVERVRQGAPQLLEVMAARLGRPHIRGVERGQAAGVNSPATGSAPASTSKPPTPRRSVTPANETPDGSAATFRPSQRPDRPGITVLPSRARVEPPPDNDTSPAHQTPRRGRAAPLAVTSQTSRTPRPADVGDIQAASLASRPAAPPDLPGVSPPQSHTQTQRLAETRDTFDEGRGGRGHDMSAPHQSEAFLLQSGRDGHRSLSDTPMPSMVASPGDHVNTALAYPGNARRGAPQWAPSEPRWAPSDAGWLPSEPRPMPTEPLSISASPRQPYPSRDKTETERAEPTDIYWPMLLEDEEDQSDEWETARRAWEHRQRLDREQEGRF